MPFLVGAAVFILYCLTLCPTVYVGDSGELTTASAVLGVAHPPGYPLYLLIGRIFTLLPVGSIALRVNLLSAAAGAAAAALLFLVVRSLLRTGEKEEADEGSSSLAKVWVALAVVGLFALARTEWLESVKAEVYTLNIFWISLILLVTLRGARPQLAYFLTGLAATNHQTVLLLLPGLIYGDLLRERRRPLDWVGAAVLFLAGLTLYAYLLVRPESPDLFMWKKAGGLSGLWAHVSRGQYGDLSTLPRSFSLFLAQLAFLLRLFLRELGLIALLVPFGIWIAWRAAPATGRRPLILHLFFFSLLLLLMLNHGTDARDGHVATVYYLPAILFAALLASFPLLDLAGRLGRLHRLAPILLVLLPVFSFMWNVRSCNAREFRMAEEIGSAMLARIENGGVLVTEGDNNTFALFYLQEVEGKREDVTILDLDRNIHPERLSPRGDRRVTPEEAEEAIERVVAAGDRPVYSATEYTDRPVAGKSLVSAGPLYRFVDDPEEVPATEISRYHVGGFDPGSSRSDYMARRFAVSYLSRWIDHYDLKENRDGVRGVRDLLVRVGEGLSEAHLVLSRSESSEGDTAGAVEELEKSVAADPSFLKARRELAERFLSMEEFESATEEFRFLAEERGRAGDFLNLGNSLVLEGKRAAAAEAYRQALTAPEITPLVFQGVSEGMARIGLLPEQATVLERFLADYPDSFRLYEDLGDAYDRVGRQDEAGRMYRKAAEVDSLSADPSYKAALLLMRDERLSEAELYLVRSVRLDSTHAPACNALAYLYAISGQKIPEGLRLVETAIRYGRPEDLGYYHDTRGVLLSKLGESDEAATAFRLAIEGVPETDYRARSETHSHLADLLRRSGQADEAKAHQAKADSLGRLEGD